MREVALWLFWNIPWLSTSRRSNSKLDRPLATSNATIAAADRTHIANRAKIAIDEHSEDFIELGGPGWKSNNADSVLKRTMFPNWDTSIRL
jgi:hypothetical protein